MADLWSSFCGCSSANDKNCDSDLVDVTNPSSCMNHFLIICFDLLLLGMLLLNVFYKSPSKSTGRSSFFQRKSRLQLVSAIFNGLLGILCSCLGIWTLKNTITANHTIRPLHQWLLFLFHGLTWLVVSPTVSLWGKRFPKTPVRLLSITAFLFTAIFGILSLISSIINKRVSTNIALDEASFLGAALLLLCTYKGYNSEETDDKGLYAPLNGKTHDVNKDNLTPLANAGFLNVMSFWWLNPLMKTGSQKTLEEKDMPKLCIGDRAESCYLTFLEQLDKQKRSDSSSQPSVMRTLVMCNLRELLISGFFALIKIITVSSGPLFLKAFIRVAEGNESFTGEGIVLAISLFFFKILESLSQRQWDFRCRLIGIRVRSLLNAAIYKKQVNLSNAAKITHLAGEIMNYATVDAYRIGVLKHATAEDDLGIIHSTLASNSQEILNPKNDINEYIKAIKTAFDSMEDGVVTPSAYDTAWVALIKDVNGPGGGPQFPSSLQWVVNHQLRDGSWGDPLMFSASDRIINTLACVISSRFWNMHPDKCKKET